MSFHARINKLERNVANVRLREVPLFFSSHVEYEQALKKGNVEKNHICFIDDVPEDE